MVGKPVTGFVVVIVFITGYACAPVPLPPSNTIVGVERYPEPELVTVINAICPRLFKNASAVAGVSASPVIVTFGALV